MTQTPPSHPPLSPSMLVHQRYAVVRLIGQGGMGAVYEAIDQRLGVSVALKQTLRPGKAFERAFKAEARLLATLRHPALPRVIDFFTDPRGHFLVMEFISGDDLEILLKQHGRTFLVDEVLEWAEQLLVALDYLHTRSPPIVHRDIKPSNLKLTAAGEVILLDFGLARGNIASFAPVLQETVTPSHHDAESTAAPGSPEDIFMSNKEEETGDTMVEPAAEPLLPGEGLHGFTPQYAAPEQIFEQQATPRSDLYSLAATLYTLLGGSRPASAEERRQATARYLTDPLRPLSALNPHVLPAVGAVLHQAMALNSDERPDSAATMRVLLRQARQEGAAAPATLVAPPPCPYPGLLPFKECDHDRFFGRAPEVQTLLHQMQHSQLHIIIGPSGSGKSSLVFAGLLPALHQQAPTSDNDRTWDVRVMRPATTPLATLREIIAPPIAPSSRLLLVVDQMEELFTGGRAEVVPFQQALRQLMITTDCHIVLTMRADFYPDLMASPFWAAIHSRRIEVAPLDAAALRQAIRRPAQHSGVDVEAALVERLIANTAGQPGGLPLVQETLVMLWDELEQRPLPDGTTALVLTLAAYEALGDGKRTGVEVALARRADAALAHLDDARLTIARRVFVRLIQFGEGSADTRRQQHVTALQVTTDDPAHFEATLQHLAEQRLITLSGATAAPTAQADHALIEHETMVDLAHEALISGWPTLRGWLNERREAEQVRRRLELRAANWASRGRQHGGLLDEAELPEAERWLESPDAADLGYDTALLAFVHASRTALDETRREKERIHRRLRQRALFLAGALFMALMAAVLAALFAVRSEQNATRAQTQAARSQAIALASAAREMFAQGNPDQALMLALAGVQADPTAAQVQVVFATMAYAPGTTRRFVGHTNVVEGVVFAPDGHTVLSVAADGTLRVWDIASGHEKHRVDLSPEVIRDIALSPDAHTALVGLESGAVQVLNPTTGQTTYRLAEHTGTVEAVAFSPDGSLALSGSQDGSVRVWEAATGQVVQVFEDSALHGVLGAAFSPDGHTVAAAGCGQFTSDGQACARGALLLWDIGDGGRTSGGEGRRFKVEETLIDSIAFMPGGAAIITGGCRATVITDEARQLCEGDMVLWDIATGRQVQRFVGHEQVVSSLAVFADGQTLASSSLDGTLRLWDIASGKELRRFAGGEGLQSVAISPDEQWLLTGSIDRTLRLWAVHNRAILHRLEGHTASVEGVAFSPDGSLALSGSQDGSVRLWEVATGRLVRRFAGHTGWVLGVAFSPDGSLALSGSQDGSVRLWEVATGRLVRRFAGHTDWVQSVAFSPDGSLIASASGTTVDPHDTTVRVWDAATGDVVHHIAVHQRPVFSVAFSPDSSLLASGSADETICLWDVASGQQVRCIEAPSELPRDIHTVRLEGTENWVQSVAFSPDGRTLLSGSNDHIVRVWDVASGHEIRRLMGHTDQVHSVAFAGSGQLAVSGSVDKTVRVWDVASGQEIRRFTYTGHASGDMVWCVAFKPDGSAALAGTQGGEVRLWRVEPLDTLIAWVENNRHLPEMSCDQRATFQVEPLCTGGS